VEHPDIEVPCKRNITDQLLVMKAKQKDDADDDRREEDLTYVIVENFLIGI
jgi:hypothetical protein